MFVHDFERTERAASGIGRRGGKGPVGIVGNIFPLAASDWPILSAKALLFSGREDGGQRAAAVTESFSVHSRR